VDDISLNHKLIEVTRWADLEADVVRKALDGRLPANPEFEPLRTKAALLRRLVQGELESDPDRLVCWFDSASYLPVGNVCENVFGPGRRFVEAESSELAALLACLRAEGILADFITIGLRRFASDHSIAVRLMQRAPRLAAIVAPPDELRRMEPLVGLGPERLDDLAPEAEAALLSLALDTDAGRACRLLGEAQCHQAVLRARLAWTRTHAGEPSSEAWLIRRSETFCDHLSLRENLLGGRPSASVHRAHERVDQLLSDTLKREGLLDLVLLAGLEYRVGQHGQNLSGGQRQKVALARVLLKNPGILLLDEATSALDEISQSKIVSLLERQFSQKTILAVSHRLSTIRNYDRIVVLDRGRKIQEGSFGELSTRPGLFRELLSQEGQPLGFPRPSFRPAHVGEGDRELESARASLPEPVRQCPLFKNLDNDQLTALLRLSQFVECPQGKAIFDRGDPGEDLFVICRGEVDFLAPAQGAGEGEQEVIDTFGPGEAFGELAVFGEMSRTLGARAHSDVTLLKLHRRQVEELLHADPEIALAFLKVMARRIGDIRGELYGSAATV
jgi:ABC-type nitrate/sulfonate/bicarbonate transport system ATPase subunit